MYGRRCEAQGAAVAICRMHLLLVGVMCVRMCAQSVVIVQVIAHVVQSQQSWIVGGMVVVRQIVECGGVYVRCRRRMMAVKSLVSLRDDNTPRPAPGVAAVLKMSYTVRWYRQGR